VARTKLLRAKNVRFVNAVERWDVVDAHHRREMELFPCALKYANVADNGIVCLDFGE
jgi:hypothetical protein